jgi:hypothetical protein
VAGLPPSPAASELIGVMTGIVVGSCSKEGAGVFVPGRGLGGCWHPRASGWVWQSCEPCLACPAPALPVSCARETPAPSRSRKRGKKEILIFNVKLPPLLEFSFCRYDFIRGEPSGAIFLTQSG